MTFFGYNFQSRFQDQVTNHGGVAPADSRHSVTYSETGALWPAVIQPICQRQPHMPSIRTLAVSVAERMEQARLAESGLALTVHCGDDLLAADPSGSDTPHRRVHVTLGRSVAAGWPSHLQVLLQRPGQHRAVLLLENDGRRVQ
jgi:hypothetical protein